MSKKSRPDVSILIPVYGRFDLLDTCLASIPAAFTENTYEILIWDNASPEENIKDKYKIWEAEYALRVSYSRINQGFPLAINGLAKQARAPYLFLLNSDVVLDPQSGDRLVETLADEKVALVGMKLVFPAESTALNRPAGRLQHIGISMDIHGNATHLFVGWNEYHPKVMAMEEVFAVTGAAMMTRKDIFRQVDGLWEGYGLGTWEDVDYAMVVRELGYNVKVNPLARGTHYTNASAEAYQIQYPLMINKVKFYERWSTKIVWTDWEYL